MTDKDIQEAIDNCIWRRDVSGIWICAGDVVPCEKHIHDGRCHTLIELFAKEGDTKNDSTEDSENKRSNRIGD